MLLTCQAGYEKLLGRELEANGRRVTGSGPGWALADGPAAEDWAFPHLILKEPAELGGDSVNALAGAVLGWFLEQLQGERIEGTWPCIWDGPAELSGLGRRIGAVEAAFHEQLKRRLSRVGKLAVSRWSAFPDAAPVGPVRGLFVWFTDFGRLQAARTAWRNGPRRMADDPAAPSRSYLKVEEAYGVLGRGPAEGETVADLGAAPGGWAYSAAQRGARVVAVDNGPLKGGALGHPRIEHRRADAFGFAPEAGGAYDWLFCDLVEEPHHVLANLVRPWLEGRWCRRFVINLKFGRVDPLRLLDELRAPASPFASASAWRVRHLYHDREEFTVTGEAGPGSPAHPHNRA